jgi:IMP dehydrogenase/GMP reductase
MSKKKKRATSKQSRLLVTPRVIKDALDYKDVQLVSRHVSTLEHRSEADTSIEFCGVRINAPMIASPMPDVCNGEMALAVAEAGAIGIIHRFQSISSQVTELKTLKGNPAVAAAVGVTGDYVERAEALYKAGCRIYCLDTANGANLQVARAFKELKRKDCFYIGGNVATAETFKYLDDLGFHAIRTGIASGGVCETRTETGYYHPMITSILEAASVRKNALIICDGGIKEPQDMCKAIAAGADITMEGSAFAGTRESPGPVVKWDGRKYKLLRGAASFSVQVDTGKRDEDIQYVEGDETLVPYQPGGAEQVIKRFRGGLVSMMSYVNAKTLEQYRANVDIVRVLP